MLTTVPDCSNVDNSIYYCYPTSDSVFYESNWTRLLWNYRNPVFTGASSLDVYLFHADSEAQVWQLSDVPNAYRSLAIQVNASWFPSPPDNESHTSPFYFAVVPSGTTLDGSISLGPTFNAVQTPAPISSFTSNTSTLMPTPTASMNMSASATSTLFIQPSQVTVSDKNSGAPGLSKGAIAGITLAALFAFLVLVTCTVFTVGWRRRAKDDATEGTTQRGSAEGPFKEGMQVLSRAAPLKSRAKTSPSRSVEVQESPSEALSMGDAALMADAFRRVLRKPDWLSVRRRDSSGMVLNGDDGSRPTSAMVENPDGTLTPSAAANREAQALMEKELAGEGKGLVPVMSRRKTRVQLGANQDDPDSPVSPQVQETDILDKEAAETA